MSLRLTLWIGAALVWMAPAGAQPATTSAILASSWLWGKDFAAALPYLRAWTEIGEQTVDVFMDRVQGHTAIRKLDDAAAAAGRLTQALDRSLAGRGLSPGSVPFRTRVVTSADDDFARVAWSDGSLTFLRPDLTIQEVVQRLGPPERISELLIQGDTDRRPVVLTLRSYGGGTISFAESDQSPQSGLVDRVLLNVSGVPGGAPPDGATPATVVSSRRAAAAPHSIPQAGVAGPDPVTLVDIATDDTDPRNFADTEPSLAVNPANPLEIAVVTFSEPWTSTTPAPVWKSSDGGTTWRKVFQIPQPAIGSSGPRDQKIAYDANGSLYIAELGSDGGGAGDFVFRQESDDPDDLLVPGTRYGNDQPHLEIDRIRASPCVGQVYSPWLNFGTSPEQSTISSSLDRGETFSDVGAGDHTYPNRTTRIAVAPSGKAYAVYKTREGADGGGFERAHFRVIRSDDCGVTWSGLGDGGLSIHGDDSAFTWFTSSWGIPGHGRKVARARSSDAWIATNSTSESVYTVYINRIDTGLGQIFLARSDDQGETWTSSRVTDDTHHAAFPEIAVTDNGAVGVLYIDYEDAGNTTIFRHHFASSVDGGSTWTDEILQAMDPSAIPNASSGFLWGDYEALTAVGNTFYGVFTGESIGRSVTQLDPIFFARSAEPEMMSPTSASASRPQK